MRALNCLCVLKSAMWVLALLLVACGNGERTAGGGGQTGNALTVLALDKSGQPIAGAKVVVREAQDKGRASALVDSGSTDVDGRYAVGSVEEGATYGIQVVDSSQNTIRGAFRLVLVDRDSTDGQLVVDTLDGAGEIAGTLPSGMPSGVYSACLLGTDLCLLLSPGIAYRFDPVWPGNYLLSLRTSDGDSLQLLDVELCPSAQVTVPLGWNQVWIDEFDGNHWDGSHWNISDGDGCPEQCGWGNQFLQSFDTNETYLGVDTGLLRITARSQEDSSGNPQFRSARLDSRGKGDWIYGRIEVRARIPGVRGAWTILSLQASDSAAGTWPEGGSIDIVSVQGDRADTLNGMLHQVVEGGYVYQVEQSPASVSLAQAFHTYAVEWDADSIRYSLDGVRYGALPGSETFRKEFHLQLELGVGGLSNRTPDSLVAFSADLLVDWVRVYQQP